MFEKDLLKLVCVDCSMSTRDSVAHFLGFGSWWRRRNELFMRIEVFLSISRG